MKVWVDGKLVFVEAAGIMFSVCRDDASGEAYASIQEYLSSPHLWNLSKLDELVEALGVVRGLHAAAASGTDWIEKLGLKRGQ